MPVAGSDYRWNPQGNKSVSSLPCSKNGCSIQPRNNQNRCFYVQTSLFQKAWEFIKHLRMVSVTKGSYNYLVKLLPSCDAQPWLYTRTTQGVFKYSYTGQRPDKWHQRLRGAHFFFFFKLSKWFQSETKVENHGIEYKPIRSAEYMWLCFSLIEYVPESESH